jgi:hypothetical protein
MPRHDRRRSVGTRGRFDRVLVVTEGDTEELYLDCFKCYFNHKALKTNNTTETAPGQLLERAERLWEESRERPRHSRDTSYFVLPYDSVWIVFDRNGNAPKKIANTTKKAKLKKIKIAFSQPCFEIWLLLHFIYSDREFSNCKEVGVALKKYDSVYSKTANFEKYMPKIKTAIDNSKKLHQFAIEHGIDSKSHTTFHELIEELLAQVQKKQER